MPVTLHPNSVLGKTSSILSGRYGVKIQWDRSGRCHTDGKTIHLPSETQAFFDDPEKGRVLSGLLDHETAHIIHSNFDKKFFSGGEKLRCLTNFIEDARIETELIKDWRGTAGNFNATNEWGLEKGIESGRLATATPVYQIGLLIFHRLKHRTDDFGLLGKHVPPEFQQAVKDFIDKNALASFPPGKAGTQSALDLATSTLEKLKKRFPPSKADPSPDPQDEKTNGDDDSPSPVSPDDAENKSSEEDRDDDQAGKGDSNGDDDSGKDSDVREDDGEVNKIETTGDFEDDDEDDDDDKDDDDNTGDDSEEDSSGDEHDDDPDPDYENEDEPPDDPEINEDEGESKDGDEKGINKGPSKTSEEKELGDQLSDDDDDSKLTDDMDSLDAMNQLQDAVEQDIRNQIKKGGDREKYLIYNPDADTSVEVVVNGRYATRAKEKYDESVMEMKAQSAGAITAMKRVFRSYYARKWKTGLRRGRLNSRAFARHIATGTPYIKKQIQEREDKKNLAVSFRIDFSLSMTSRHGTSHTMLDTAITTVGLICEMLHELQIPFDIVGHTTTGDRYDANEDYASAIKKYGKNQPFSRFGGTAFYILKSFGEFYPNVTDRMGSVAGITDYYGGGGSNVDLGNTHEVDGILHGVNALLERSEERKVLFLLTDGEPYPRISSTGPDQNRFASLYAEEAEAKHGVEVVAIGLCTPHVRDLYPKHHLVIEDMSQIPTILATDVCARLKKGLDNVRSRYR